MLVRRRDLQRHLQIKHGNDLQQQLGENSCEKPVLMSPIYKSSSSESEDGVV